MSFFISSLILYNAPSTTVTFAERAIFEIIEGEDFLKRFENYKGYNSKFMDAVSNFVRSNLDHDENLADQCVSRLRAFDKVRKNNFQNIIPVDYFL